MKKLLAMILVLAMMAFCLVACGSKKEDKTPDNEVINGGDTEATTEVTPEGDKSTYVRGTVDGSKWFSEWIGLQFDCGSSYVMTTEAELQTLMQQAGEMFDFGNIDYSAMTNVYEMMAVSLTGDNVIVATEKLALSNMTLDQYITALKSQMSMMYGDALEMGEKTTYTLAGVEFTKIEGEMNANGISVSQFYLLKKIDDRIVVITFTETADGGFETMTERFSAYNG